MIDNLIKELQELKEYKIKYEFSIKNKQRMSDELYKLMTQIYKSKTREERKNEFVNDTCKCCRYKDDCEVELHEDIAKPIKSNDAWIPSTIGCKEFEWD